VLLRRCEVNICSCEMCGLFVFLKTDNSLASFSFSFDFFSSIFLLVVEQFALCNVKYFILYEAI